MDPHAGGGMIRFGVNTDGLGPPASALAMLEPDPDQKTSNIGVLEPVDLSGLVALAKWWDEHQTLQEMQPATSGVWLNRPPVEHPTQVLSLIHI